MRLPRTQFRGVAHFVYAKWPRSGPEVWRSAGVIATLWQPRLVSCAGLVGQVEVERVVTLPWAQWSSASGFCNYETANHWISCDHSHSKRSRREFRRLRPSCERPRALQGVSSFSVQ